MKRLLLMRHAKSSWKEPGISDHDQPLGKQGKGDAPWMGALLVEKGLVPDLIISSTAKRAHDTARLVAEACGYEQAILLERELYLAPPGAYFQVLRSVEEEFQTVLMVGHNPGVEQTLAVLTGEVDHFPTAAVAVVEVAGIKWREIGAGSTGWLVHFWKPKEPVG